MANVAGFQTQAQNSAFVQLGVPVSDLLDGYTSAGVATATMTVAGAAFSADTNPVLNASFSPTSTASATNFAGIVLRSNANGMGANGSLNAGYDGTIPAGRNVTVITRGSVPVVITTASEAGGAPIIGSIVYVNPTTGAFYTQIVGGTAPANTVATNFRVLVSATAGYTAGVTPVIISNIQNVGA